MSSIHDVAKKAGVSTATVSRTFSSPELLNEQTQQRVLEVARQLNYQPRRLRVAESKTRPTVVLSNAIGFQFFAAEPQDALLSNMFYAPVLAGAQAEAASLGMHLLLHATDRHSLSMELPRMVLERTVKGMLLVGTADLSILSTFARHVPHIVLVDNHDETDTYESVVSDGFGGAYTATRYLLERGHRRIGYFLSEPGVTTFQDRLRGYFCAQLEAGLLPDMALVIANDSTRESSTRLGELLASAQPPTALITANDHCALYAMRACREMGLQIPDDISLIGFDDIASSTHVEVPLTTMRVNKEFMGRLAVRRLVARMNQSDDAAEGEPPVCNLVPVSLVERQSCCRRTP